MNQLKWTYVDDGGKKNIIGLAHGPESGNFLVYCNTEIVIIEFKIFESKNFTFFIDEELCEISVERKDDEFLYSFVINKKADTPLNRKRKLLDKKDMIKSVAAVAFVLAMVFTFTVFFAAHKSSNKSLYGELANSGKETSARIYLHPEGKQKLVSHNFIVSGKTYASKQQYNRPPVIAMPLVEGDEFMVKYLPKNPSLHRIDFKRPTNEQIEIYRNRVLEKLSKLEPETNLAFANCLLDVAYQTKGVSGLADIYFQDIEKSVNSKHNKESYTKMKQSITFKNLMKKNCTK